MKPDIATSQAWVELKRMIEARIEELRTILEDPLSETDTAHRRGAIKELRELIESVEGSPQNS